MILFKQYVLTAAAVKLSDSTIFNVGSENASPVTVVTKIRELSIINSPTALNIVLLGGSNVTNAPANAGYILNVGLAKTYGPYTGEFLDLRDIYIVGTVNALNAVAMTVVLA